MRVLSFEALENPLTYRWDDQMCVISAFEYLSVMEWRMRGSYVVLALETP